MKRSWVILTLLVCVLAFSATAQATTYWTKMSGAAGTTPMFPDGSYTKVQAIDANTVVATSYGYLETMLDITGMYKQVWMSTDGGATMQLIYDGNVLASGLLCKSLLLINDIHFADANNGMIFGSWAGMYSGCNLFSTYHNYIANTSNAGTSWDVIALTPNPAGPSLYAQTFLNENTAFAAGAADNFWASTNAGGSWTQLAAATPYVDGIEFHSISAASENDIYAAGEVYAGDDDSWWDASEDDNDWGGPSNKSFQDLDAMGGQLVYSNNGGLSWNTLLTATDLDDPLKDKVGFHKVQFIGDNGWLLLVSATERLIALKYSTDKGATWNDGALPTIDTIGDPGDSYIVSDFQMLNASVGWAVGYSFGDSSVILTTNDGGVTWTADEYTGYGPLLAIHMLDGRHGFAVGKRLAVLQYTNTSNEAPVADAGDDQTVPAGQIVDLDGSASYDPDGDTIQTWVWTQADGPETVSLAGADTATPSFTPLTAGDYVFELIVSDGIDSSTPDSVTITISGSGDDDSDDDDTGGGLDDDAADDADDDDDDDNGGCCG